MVNLTKCFLELSSILFIYKSCVYHCEINNYFKYNRKIQEYCLSILSDNPCHNLHFHEFSLYSRMFSHGQSIPLFHVEIGFLFSP